MIRHLDRCEPCRKEVAVLAEFAAAGTTERATRSGWWLAAAASLVTIAGIAVWRYGPTADDNRLPVAPLVAATASLEFRLVEPRLSGGFGWAEYRGPARSSTEVRNPKLLKLHGAAGDVLQEASANPTPETEHAAAIASLLTSDPAAAVEKLKKVTEERPNDARAWSDLAAARHTSALHFKRMSELSLALAAANKAIELDPKLAEAYFNRALIVQQMGLPFEAREAWTKYLEVDPNSKWTVEARAKLDALPAATNQSLFDAQKPQLERSAAAGDAAAVRAFVDRFPQQSRSTAESDLLARWADATRAGDGAEAGRALAAARLIGGALRARGEELVADMVAAIDAAPEKDRRRLADAHALFRDGTKARPTPHVARRRFLEAAAAFGDTPGALNARFFAAASSERALDYAIAERELRELQARTPSRYKALHAHTSWVLGLIQGKLARWSGAIEHYESAVALFDEIGERGNAAWMTWLIGEAASFLGRRDDAWQSWAAALPALSHAGMRVSTGLNGISRAELVAGHPDAARAIAGVALKHGGREGPVSAEVLYRLALLNARTGNHAHAAAALTEAQSVASAIPDPGMREQTMADLEFAEGVVYTKAAPYRALDALTRAAERHRREWRPMLLPATLYERACVLRSLGRDHEAQSDLESAIDAIESQREPVEWRSTESGALDGVDEIYATLAELLLERGRAREAFVIADRAAVHAFYGARATGSVITLDALQQQLAPGSVVVEYLVRPRKTIIFVVGPRTFEIREANVASKEVKRLAQALDTSLRNRAPLPDVTRASAELQQVLLAPVRDLLAGASDVTFVLDPLIASVPLPALRDPESGRWFVQDHSIRVAASVLFRDAAAHKRSSNVVVIHPWAGVSLPRTETEVATILRLYPQATLLQGEAMTVASVLEAMRDAAVVHYAGHSDSRSEAGLVLRASDVLYGDDIARTPLRAAPLVVLAGCRTLRGGARREDLVTSLARAFLLAGARSVVGTTWDVDDDDAAPFFSRFHELNSATGNPVAALSEAQRSMLHDGRRHPAEWAFAQIVVRTLDV